MSLYLLYIISFKFFKPHYLNCMPICLFIIYCSSTFCSKHKINKYKYRISRINIAASSDGGPKPSANATPVASGKLCPAGTCITLTQRFSIPVLAPHRSAHFVCYSYHFRRLFYSNASALRSGHHTIFLHDSSSKRMYSIHSALKCARREFKLYIFTEVYDVTLVRA